MSIWKKAPTEKALKHSTSPRWGRPALLPPQAFDDPWPAAGGGGLHDLPVVSSGPPGLESLAMALHNFLVARLPFMRALLLLLALGLPLAAPAQSIAVQNLAVLVDADGSETIASVSAPGAAQRFTPLDGLF